MKPAQSDRVFGIYDPISRGYHVKIAAAASSPIHRESSRDFRPESVNRMIRAVFDNVDIDRRRCIQHSTSSRFPILKDAEK